MGWVGWACRRQTVLARPRGEEEEEEEEEGQREQSRSTARGEWLQLVLTKYSPPPRGLAALDPPQLACCSITGGDGGGGV